MPALSYTPYDGRKAELEVVFDITALETYGSKTEGWLRYNLVMSRNGAEFVAISGTVHNNDVMAIEDLIGKGLRKAESYEPLEPDFKIRVEDNDDLRFITWMANHGLATDHAYDDAGIGMCLPLEKSACEHFVEELRAQRLGFVKDLEFRNFKAVNIPE